MGKKKWRGHGFSRVYLPLAPPMQETIELYRPIGLGLGLYTAAVVQL